MFVKPTANPNHKANKTAAADHVTQDFETLQVFDPALKNFLPPEGRNVGDSHSHYWARQITEGSVERMADEEAAAKSIAAAEARRFADAEAKREEARKAAAAKAAPASSAAPAAKPNTKGA